MGSRRLHSYSPTHAAQVCGKDDTWKLTLIDLFSYVCCAGLRTTAYEGIIEERLRIVNHKNCRMVNNLETLK